MALPKYQAKFFTHDQIRKRGAVGNLNEGVVIRTQGVHTRLIAWPGNGYQTESVHVLTLKPGESSSTYAYSLAEETMLCAAGCGEVFLLGKWTRVAAGDVAYFPEGVAHAVRNPAGNTQDFVLVTQIAPPQFDLYAEAGFYHVGMGVMNFDAACHAGLNADSGTLQAPLAMQYRETEPEAHAWNRSPESVRREGALFNVFKGADFAALGIPARLVIWPGAGSRMAGFNFAFSPRAEADFIHTHPVSDECLILWAGKGRGFMGEEWFELDTLDCLLAPCGVLHAHWGAETFWGGFASPPQIDLICKTPYYKDGVIRGGGFSELVYPKSPGLFGE
jgi:gentisate 1,2-dioxygenase